jgi:hypothetical protein
MDIARTVWGTGPHAPRRVTERMKVAGFVVGLLLFFVEIKLFGDVRSTAEAGKRLSVVILGAPILVLGGVAYYLLERWCDRATEPFAFPRIVQLPGWAVWSASADMLVLAKARSMICLIRHEPANIDTVLDAIDPDRVLESPDDEEESSWRIKVELPGDPVLSGQFRMLGDGAYLLMLGPPSDAELLADVDATYLPRARVRGTDEAPQKFRPLANSNKARVPKARSLG